MGYKFHDFGEAVSNSPFSIRSMVDNVYLEEMLSSEGFSFTTLSVSGRAKTSYEIDAIKVPGNDGELQRSRQLSARTIVIRALVTAKTNEDYRVGMAKLNAFVYKKQLNAVKFSDDLEHTYYGSCQRVEDGDETSNRQIVEIEFYCADPFKYTETKTYTVTSGQPLVIDTAIRIVPEQILLKYASATSASSFTLTNATTSDRIKYERSGTAETALVYIRQKDDFIGPYTNVNKLEFLNVLYSNFDEFSVDNGDYLSVTPQAEITITYRGARL